MSKKIFQTLSLSAVLFYGVAGNVNAAAQENACQALAECATNCQNTGWQTACTDGCKAVNWPVCIAEAGVYYGTKDAKTATGKAEQLATTIWKDAKNGVNYCVKNQDACNFGG